MKVVHASHAGIDKRLCARTRATGMRTRLQGDHGGGSSRPIASLAQRHDLGMRASHGLRSTDAHDVTGSGHDDRAHWRVGARGSTHLSSRGHCPRQRCGKGTLL